ncbi:ribonuclease HIII [Mycoplasmopsis felifaucium]|uniref:ribonuclease HIII n=1 Tax=Mycoplasmopsis felifaucium TaxID=35768 RepID=UPI00056A8047|nr:ribonuclease HIII [Mycoplasmopsis felifaucium]
MKFIEYENSIDLLDKNIIGIDEAGVSDYFGPMCSAAVFVKNENISKIIELGVKDSKLLKDEQIKLLATKLKKSNLISYSCHQLSPSGFNKLNKNYNVNELKMFTHLNAFNNLFAKIKNNKTIDYIFIDQYSTYNTIKQYYNKFIVENNWAKLEPFNADVLLAHKAEKLHISVAAASILARDYYLTLMDIMSQKFNTVFPRGVRTKVEEFRNTFFNSIENDKNIINEVCKVSFKMKEPEKHETVLVSLFD